MDVSVVLSMTRMSNSIILENKAHLAVLQSRMKDVPTLEVRMVEYGDDKYG